MSDALEYMEREAAVTRRGSGGRDAIPGNGFIAAAFRHRTSRAGDPQLHTHVLVANLTLGWPLVDPGRPAHLRPHQDRGLPLRGAPSRGAHPPLGVEWTPVRNGIAEIAGIPPDVLRAFSRRRAEIEQELSRRGESSPGAAQVVALQTRRSKDYSVAPDQLEPEWR